MVALLAVLVGLGFLLANPIADQVVDVPARRARHYVDDANRALADLQDWLDRKGINIQVKEEGQTALQTLGDRHRGGAGRRRRASRATRCRRWSRPASR